MTCWFCKSQLLSGVLSVCFGLFRQPWLTTGWWSYGEPQTTGMITLEQEACLGDFALLWHLQVGTRGLWILISCLSPDMIGPGSGTPAVTNGEGGPALIISPLGGTMNKYILTDGKWDSSPSHILPRSVIWYKSFTQIEIKMHFRCFLPSKQFAPAGFSLSWVCYRNGGSDQLCGLVTVDVTVSLLANCR